MNVVGTATDGGSGLELARKQRPDLVITDLELPGMSGLEISEALRQQFPGIRVIVISVHEGCMWQNLSRRKGADAFLSKHNLHTDLLALIERLFARCAAGGPCIAN
jgi:DNA-binding NarL/FixJ family response regulator